MSAVSKATVPGAGTLNFAPGGYHVMLEEPKAPLVVGLMTPLNFLFSDGSAVTVSCMIKPASATGN